MNSVIVTLSRVIYSPLGCGALWCVGYESDASTLMMEQFFALKTEVAGLIETLALFCQINSITFNLTVTAILIALRISNPTLLHPEDVGIMFIRNAVSHLME